MTFSWRNMDPETNAAFERSQGKIVLTHGGIHWQQVRPRFFRPILPFHPYPADSVRLPAQALLGGCQFAVPADEQANSLLNMLVFERTGEYTADSLPRTKRQQLRKAAGLFQVRQMDDAEAFKRSAYPVYLSFQDRTGYIFKEERREPEGFARWADSIFRYDQNLVLGAYQDGDLHAVSISRRVEDTVMYATVFSTDAALAQYVNSLMLHTLREAAAAAPGVKRMFITMADPAGPTGTEAFFLDRGCRLLRQPARYRLNPLAWAFLKFRRPAEFAKLLGRPR